MPPAPKMKRLAYHVWLAPAELPDGVTDALELPDDALEYHHVLVGNGDQLRAELEANQLRIKPVDNPMHLTNLWLWAALVRTGVVDSKFRDFKASGRLVNYDPDRDRDQPHTDPDAELDDLDPNPTVASSG